MTDRSSMVSSAAVVLDVIVRVGALFVAIDVVRLFAGRESAPNSDGGPANLIAFVAASWAVWNVAMIVVWVRRWTTKGLDDVRPQLWLAALSGIRWVLVTPLTDDYWGQDDRFVRLLAVGSIACALLAVVAIVMMERLTRARVEV